MCFTMGRTAAVRARAAAAAAVWWWLLYHYHLLLLIGLVIPPTTSSSSNSRAAFAPIFDLVSRRNNKSHDGFYRRGGHTTTTTTTTKPSVHNKLIHARLVASTRLKTKTRISLMLSPSSTLSLSSTSYVLVRIVFLRALAFVHAVAFYVALQQNKALIGDKGITPARNILNQAQERGRIKQERRVAWRKLLQERKQQQQQQQSSYQLPLLLPVWDDGFWGILSRTKVMRALGEYIDNSRRLSRLREILWYRADRLDRPITSLLWLAKDRERLDPWLDGVAVVGLFCSMIVFVLGAANVSLMFALWLCQRSLMSVGGPWYGYGWEPQLNELSFHTLFLVPIWSLNPIPNTNVMSPLVQWTIKWHLFRIVMGAGLIKFKANDRKWKDLTAMNYFYETQPVPNPLTRYFHWMPPLWHKLEVLTNHFVEVIAPWLLLIPGLPTTWRRASGLVQLIFQAVLITSGNLSFLNWLTMVPAILCLDDAFLSRLFGPATRQAAMLVAATQQPTTMLRRLVSFAFLLFILQLSVPVVRNLCAKKQIMNSSFDKLRLVNTYGAFGVVNKHRDEFIILGSSDLQEWKEYEFKVKPGDVNRMPRWISPYHMRLDWQMWIASACRTIDRSPWMFNFLLKLLEQDPGVTSLLAKDPFQQVQNDQDGNVKNPVITPTPAPPKYIRILLYRYKFHKPKAGEKDAPYWDRQLIGRVYPRIGVATISSLQDEIRERQSQ